MEVNRYLDELGKPFDAKDISWRLQAMNKEKTGGYAVPYLDSRAITERLDSVVGQLRWKDAYTPWHNVRDGENVKASQLCTIFIYDETLGEWIGKTDGADDSDIEPVKGGLSDAIKRAAVKWNIGRYLYQFDAVWVEAEQRGRSYIIKTSERTKLDNLYHETVQKLFGKSQNAPTQTPQSTPKAPPSYNADAIAEGPVYTIEGVQQKKGTSGVTSLLSLNFNNNKVQAYYKGADNALQRGVKLKNLILQQKQGQFGAYNVLEQYEIAA